MREYRLAVATAAAALTLAVMGALVGDGGLACPDWPLCQGSPLPALTGPVLIEQGHRIVAFGVAVMTAVLAGLVVRSRSDPRLRRLAVAAVALVAIQAGLGGLTVVFGLPAVARVGHLVVAMAFFALVVHLAARLRPAGEPAGRRHPAEPVRP